jgi:hypothetical protein
MVSFVIAIMPFGRLAFMISASGNRWQDRKLVIFLQGNQAELRGRDTLPVHHQDDMVADVAIIIKDRRV